MNSELLNPLPGLKKLSVAGWAKEEGANVAARETLEKTCGSSDKIKEGKNREGKGERQTCLPAPEDPGPVARKSININCSRRPRRRNLEIEQLGLLPPFSGGPVASSATKFSILGILRATDGVRCSSFSKRTTRSSNLQTPLHRVATPHISPCNQKRVVSP